MNHRPFRARFRAFSILLAVCWCAGMHAHAQVLEQWRAVHNTTRGAEDAGQRVARDAAGNIFIAATTKDARTGLDWVVRKYAAATGTLLWVQHLNGQAGFDDAPRGIAVDAAGNVIVTGYAGQNISSRDIHTAKYAGADGTLLWEVNYNGPGNNNDEPNGLALDAAGNAIVTGVWYNNNVPFPNFDGYTVKYSAATGAVLWEHRYDGPPGRNDDAANAVAVDGNGNVAVAGWSIGTASSKDYFTVRYAAADGSLLWEKRYTTPGTADDLANAVAFDATGNVFVTGQAPTVAGYDIYTAKYAAANGALLWEKTYNGPGNVSLSDIAVAATVDHSGNVIVVGNSNAEAYAAKYAAANGALLWDRRYNGLLVGNDYFQAVALDAADNVVVTGYTGLNLGQADIYTAKYAAATGAILWEKTYNGAANIADEAFSVVVDASSNVIITGFSRNSTDSDVYTAKYAAASGALLWEKRENGAQNNSEQGHVVALDAAGNVVMTGSSHIAGGTNEFDAYTVKYAAGTGAMLWQNFYDGGVQGNDSGDAIALDGAGNVAIAASSGGANGRSNIYTAKYAAATGALVWERRYDSASFSGASPVGVAFDAAGNVVVGGTANNSGTTGNDFYVAKYVAATGAILWERTYTGSGSVDEVAAAMTLDSSGNVIVVGRRGSSPTDYLTAKFSGATGALIWAKTYAGPAGDSDSALAVAADAGGNVIVTGLSVNPAGNNDFYTVKYAAADGAFVWEKRYDGPVANADQANAIGVDSSGNVFVTGTSRSAAGNAGDDIYTAKYAAASGALLWERRYNGSGGSSDQGNALRVDAAGNVVVAGSVTGVGGQVDLYTAKYAANDGAVIFETITAGQGGGADTFFSQRSLALQANGLPVVTAISRWGASGDTDALTVLFAPNPPPSGGTFTLAPPSPVPPATAMTATAAGWSDANLPLNYEFLLDAVSLGPRGAPPSVNFNAPAASGSHIATLRVFDALGAFTETSQAFIVDNPPVARVATLGAVSGSATRISVAKLQKYATDADGDAFTIIAVSPSSAQGGTVTLLNGVITYTPPGGYPGPDSFTYTLQDDRGATSTGTVNVSVAAAAAPSLNVVSITGTADGFLVKFAGIPGTLYVIQYRDTLNDAWQVLVPPGSIAAGPNGLFEFEDKPSPIPPSRFYRASEAP